MSDKRVQTKREGLYWNHGPSLYEHVPFGVRITPYGASLSQEVRIPWHPKTRFFQVEDLDRKLIFYGSALECSIYTGADRRVIKTKAKRGGLYRRRYRVSEISFEQFVIKTGRTMRTERRFAGQD